MPGILSTCTGPESCLKVQIARKGLNRPCLGQFEVFYTCFMFLLIDDFSKHYAGTAEALSNLMTRR